MSNFVERFQRLFGDVDPAVLRRFAAHHRRNPLTYNLFKEFSLQALRVGRKHFSHWAVANRIRWYTSVETDGKMRTISNNYVTLYARLLILQHPEFEGFFTLKNLKGRSRSIEESKTT